MDPKEEKTSGVDGPESTIVAESLQETSVTDREISDKDEGLAREPTAEPNSASPDAEAPIARQPSGEPYSVFTVNQKRLMILTASTASLFSPMSSSIYYPSLDTIAKDLHTSNANINLTATTFLIVQGLAPMMIAGFSDASGRRPAYVICFVIYLAVDIGLALQNSYAALMVLRCLQSGGSSGLVALANGLVGDCVTSAERGAYIAYASVGSVLGPMVAPVIGGLLSQYAGWHWIFWFLFIFGAVVFVPLLFFLPETCRKIVDNGTIPPPPLNNNLADIIRHRRRAKRGIPVNEVKLAEMRKNYQLKVPNPLTTLVILTNKESAIILLSCGMAFSCFYSVSAGASQLFNERYGFDALYTSFMFIPVGAGGLLSAFSTGKLVDWNYRRHAKKHNLPVTKNRRQDLSNFPIEQARLEVILPLYILCGLAIIGYGWVMHYKVNLAGPIILLFFAGWGLTSTFQTLNVLMVDIYPGRPATATAANNLVRCELGAAFSAAINPMTTAMGSGWAYTLLALLLLANVPVLLIIMKRGVEWRRQQKEKDEMKRLKQEKREEEKLAQQAGQNPAQ